MDTTGDDLIIEGPIASMPVTLAKRHRDLQPGDRLTVTLSTEMVDRVLIADIVAGAGFDPGPTGGMNQAAGADSTDESGRKGPGRESLKLTRLHTLADTVGPDMGLLICGLNPSPYSADSGIGFGRPGNRFWPAALKAGVVSRDRDPFHALTGHGVGMTDLVKRTTRTASELSAEEYHRGLHRVERLIRWLQPKLVCFVGLAGWRAAVDRSAVAGRQQAVLGGRPVYLMPSTSGLNASSRLDDLADHLRVASELAR